MRLLIFCLVAFSVAGCTNWDECEETPQYRTVITPAEITIIPAVTDDKGRIISPTMQIESPRREDVQRKYVCDGAEKWRPVAR